MLNHTVIMGRLTRDPELRRTQSGTPVATFSLAVDRDYANKETGERQADFIDVVAWRQAAEFVSKYFSKGRMAVVDGRLQSRSWTGLDHQKHYRVELVASTVYFGEPKREDAAGGAQPEAPSASDFAMLEDDDSELPF